MNIFVACPLNHSNPAVRALKQEGIEVAKFDLDDDLDYGKMITSIWRRGEGFILVEGDVIPWPGACKQLWSCEEPWCGFEYPHGNGHLSAALGFMRVRGDIVEQAPNLPYRIEPHRWDRLHWNSVDHIVMMAISETVNQYMHIHTPPVAHAREREL